MSSNESSPENLGTAEIDSEGRLSLPTAVVEWGVLSPESEAYWVYDQSTDRLVVTRSQPSIDEHANYSRFDSTSVSEDGEVTLPDELLAEGDERPWTGLFRGGGACHFDTTVDMAEKGLSYVLTNDQHEAFWND